MRWFYYLIFFIIAGVPFSVVSAEMDSVWLSEDVLNPFYKRRETDEKEKTLDKIKEEKNTLTEVYVKSFTHTLDFLKLPEDVDILPWEEYKKQYEIAKENYVSISNCPAVMDVMGRSNYFALGGENGRQVVALQSVYCLTLKMLKEGIIAEKSYVNNTVFNRTFLNNILPVLDVGPFCKGFLATPAYGELVEIEEALNHVSFSTFHDNFMLKLLARGDINHDGYEDLIIMRFSKPKERGLTHHILFIVTKFSYDSPFKLVRWHWPFDEKGQIKPRQCA